MIIIKNFYSSFYIFLLVFILVNGVGFDILK